MLRKMIVIFLIACCSGPTALARDAEAPEGPDVTAEFSGDLVAFFYQAGFSMELNAIAMKSLLELSEVFMKLGRLYPVGGRTVDQALAAAGPGADYDVVARDLGCSLYAMVSLSRQGEHYLATIAFHALKDHYRGFARQVTIRSAVLNNIPLKLAREAAHLHRDLGLTAPVAGDAGAGRVYIGAGQWHGLVPGRYNSDRGRVDVIRTFRYASLARVAGNNAAGSALAIRTFPDYVKVVHELDESIDRNTVFHFSPGADAYKGDDPGKRFAKALAVVNNGASIILPGYGAYMACGYLGVKEKVSIPGVVLSVALVFTQFTLTEMMTEFKTNFAPWIRDSDKTRAVQNLQIFCWSTLLSTYAVSFLDQLSHQYTLARKLPPLFEHQNRTAAFLSLIVPGGGLFYKGWRIGGWSFYFAEMALAGYGAYSTGRDKNYRYAFGALALVKVIDVLCAYLVEPSYPVYRQERERQAGRVSFSLNVIPDNESGNYFMVSSGVSF
jgi:hypothetical protein